jgi:hypothetical protein
MRKMELPEQLVDALLVFRGQSIAQEDGLGVHPAFELAMKLLQHHCDALADRRDELIGDEIIAGLVGGVDAK